MSETKAKIDRFNIRQVGFGYLNYIKRDDGEWCDAEDVAELENKIIDLEQQNKEYKEFLHKMKYNTVNYNELHELLEKYK